MWPWGIKHPPSLALLTHFFWEFLPSAAFQQTLISWLRWVRFWMWHRRRLADLSPKAQPCPLSSPQTNLIAACSFTRPYCLHLKFSKPPTELFLILLLKCAPIFSSPVYHSQAVLSLTTYWFSSFCVAGTWRDAEDMPERGGGLFPAGV